MGNKGVKICMIILFTLAIIILINIMIVSIIRKDEATHKMSFFAIGDHTEKLFEQEYDVKEIENIKVNTNSSNVKFIEGKENKAKVTIYGIKDTTFAVNQNEKELEINEENHNYYIFALFFFAREEIIVELPKNYEGNADIQVTSGNVEITDLENVNIKIEGKSGNVKCGNLKNIDINITSGNINIGNSNEANLKAKSGNIRAGNAKKGTYNTTSGNIKVGIIKEATLEVTSGNIEVEEIENGKANTTSGSIRIENTNSIIAKATSGNIKIGNIKTACNLETTSGGIKIEDCNLKENSEINAKSGGVRIGNINDVFINAKSKSGGVNVKDTDRKLEIELKIETTSGSIRAR